MSTTTSQAAKAEQFRKLHHSAKMLVFPNIWDTLGAVLIESLGFPAVATASAAIAYTNGYDDGENIPLDNLLTLLTKITNSVAVPVTADIESGYASNDEQLRENIKRIISTGIAGINLEDSSKESNTLLPIESQCNRIGIVKTTAREMGVPLFINARTDVYIHGKEFTNEEAKLAETIKRGQAYKNAGADCFFPIVMRREEDIKKTVAQLQMPVNILALPGVPDLSKLNEIGVARVSLGPSLLKIAIRAMKNIAVNLHNYQGLSEITENEITSDYLKNLVTKNMI